MALHNDIDPLPETRVAKIKYLTNPFSKIKPIFTISISKLANAIFLLGNATSSLSGRTLRALDSAGKEVHLQLRRAKPYLPHISFVIVAVLATATNLVVKYAKADFTVSYPEPATEISVASMTDPYTPIIQRDGLTADAAYQSSGGAFVALNNSVDTVITEREEPLPDNSSSTISYVVQQGDTLTVLGWKFNVKLATLMYLNDIDNANLVKPGQSLKIPPKGYEVSSSAIAKKEREKQLASAKRNTTIRNSSSTRNGQSGSISVRQAAGSAINGYPYGYCTYYVASKRYVPSNWGNAKNWLNSAQRAGYSTGREPAVGSIGVTSESWWGHVTYVEAVNGDSVTISEMNAVGWGKRSTRTLPASYFRGFIY